MNSSYGPLAALIGVWSGNNGHDVAPEDGDKEENSFYETITFSAAGVVDNAEEQHLAAVQYHQTVYRKRDDKLIHNQTGYWLYDQQTEAVIHSFTIPRGVCVMAKGGVSGEEEKTVLNVAANADDPNFGIVQTPFMQKKAFTRAFSQTMTFDAAFLSYSQTTTVDIYGGEFAHTDSNTLKKVG